MELKLFDIVLSGPKTSKLMVFIDNFIDIS